MYPLNKFDTSWYHSNIGILMRCRITSNVVDINGIGLQIGITIGYSRDSFNSWFMLFYRNQRIVFSLNMSAPVDSWFPSPLGYSQLCHWFGSYDSIGYSAIPISLWIVVPLHCWYQCHRCLAASARSTRNAGKRSTRIHTRKKALEWVMSTWVLARECWVPAREWQNS